MTKEELVKEAEEKTKQYMNEHTKKYNCENTKLETDNYNAGREYGYEEGYLAGAEPREKQIEIDAKQIIALQQQKGELTDKVRELEVELSKLKPYRCKNHYAISEKETSNAVLCYKVQNCESCGHFKEIKEK